MAKRSYYEEINEMEATWQMGLQLLPLLPQNLSADWLKGSAFCIGSGGSLPLAKLWQNVHESYGLGIAKTLTPFEFNYTKSIPAVVILFSASGKNHDILQVFLLALRRGCKILVFTATQHSALVRLAKMHSGQAVVLFPSSKVPRDGFLAVNSVVFISRLMVHLLGHLFGEKIEDISLVRRAIDDHNSNGIKNSNLTKQKTIQIISSEWGVPAGIDLETRLAESAIGTCFLTDPRNFGHGRFLWLDRYKSSTLVVIIHTPESVSFIRRFKRTLPSNAKCHMISSSYSGLLGGIYCILRTILLLADLAKQQKIDPGKPHVPLWGRKLHSLRINGNMEKDSNDISRRKIETYPALSTPFSGVVLDMDGTLVDTLERFKPIKKNISKELTRLLKDGLKIGFATGRGSSALDLLKKHIPAIYHEEIPVGLYNGTVITHLSATEIVFRADVWPLQKYILKILQGLTLNNCETVVRSTQISIRGLTDEQKSLLHETMLRKLGQKNRFIKLHSSGHSVDILPSWATKLAVVQTLLSRGVENILCVGDQGQSGGNDEELLTWCPSVSVGNKRPISNACLWIGRYKTYQESSGTLLVLKSIVRDGNLYKLNLKV